MMCKKLMMAYLLVIISAVCSYALSLDLSLVESDDMTGTDMKGTEVIPQKNIVIPDNAFTLAAWPPSAPCDAGDVVKESPHRDNDLSGRLSPSGARRVQAEAVMDDA